LIQQQRIMRNTIQQNMHYYSERLGKDLISPFGLHPADSTQYDMTLHISRSFIYESGGWL
jgi:hypothetical protein